MALTKQEEVLLSYERKMGESKGLTLEKGWILLLGAMSAGKTVLGFSASDQFPDEVPAEKPTQLDDIGYVPIESGGEHSLQGLRLKVNPRNVVPFDEILADVKSPNLAMQISVELLNRMGVRKALFDSISKFDGIVQAFLQTAEGKQLWDQGNRRSMFGASLSMHNVAQQDVQKFTGLKILTFHPLPVFEDLDSKGAEKGATALAMDKAMERRDKAAGSIAQADLVLGVTGGAKAIWPKDASLILGLQQVKKDGKYVRQVLTQFDEKSGLAVKSRFEGILDPIEPGHLRKMIEKIRKFA
jgi:hypothetical protein